MRRRAAVCIGAAALLGTARRAVADEKVTCVAAADAGQQQRSAGKLRDARTSFQVCAREVCPAIVRTDCTQWLAEVVASVPTIVLRASDAKGRDIADVRVQLDNQPILGRLDGLPIEVDPGRHVLAFDRPGSKKHRQEFVVNTADRNRTISVVLEDVDPPPQPFVPPPAPERPKWQPSPAAWVLAGVGFVATGSWAYFGLRGRAEIADMRKPTGCAPGGGVDPTCSHDQVQSARNKLIIADISLGTAVLSTGIATYLFLTARKSSSISLPTREVTVAPLPGGAAAVWLERF